LTRISTRRRLFVTAAALSGLLALAGRADAATVYRWVDVDGILHLSSEKPPAGVDYERIKVASAAASNASPGSGRGGSGSPAVPVSPARAAERSEMLGSLRTRECVIALESLDRLTSGLQPTSAAEIRRLKETVASNCSPDPTRRRQQEEMAAQLRVSNGPLCIEARNRLADMLEPEAGVPGEQVRLQQRFVDEHCTPPVR
jgi:hypothetical protein